MTTAVAVATSAIFLVAFSWGAAEDYPAWIWAAPMFVDRDLKHALFITGWHPAEFNLFPSIMSTYATSAIWIAFVASVMVLAALKRGSALCAVALETVQSYGVVFLVSALCALCWPLLFVCRLLWA